VRLYTTSYELVATHQRAAQMGERLTHLDHLPPEKLPQLTWTREMCRGLAADVGPATTQVVQTLLADTVIDRHPRVVRILKLRESVGDERLERACARALRFGELTYTSIKRILEQRLEVEDTPQEAAPAQARTFVRSASELLGHLFGGLAWS
jgi:hypothetical protein